MKLVSRLLRKNTSVPRIVGFVISNFIGLAIAEEKLLLCSAMCQIMNLVKDLCQR